MNNVLIGSDLNMFKRAHFDLTNIKDINNARNISCLQNFRWA